MNKKLLAATIALLAGSVGSPALAAENPMDDAGIQHNMYLGCLMDVNASANDSLIILVDKCGYDPKMPLERFIAIQQPIIDSIDPTRPLSENLAGMRNQFSGYEFSFIDRIDQIAENAEDMNVAARQFDALEQEAIGRLDPNSKNGALILGGLSVAKHSNRYWSDYAAKSGQPTANGATSKGRFWKWLAVVLADVAGYFSSSNNSSSTIVNAGASASGSYQAYTTEFGSNNHP